MAEASDESTYPLKTVWGTVAEIGVSVSRTRGQPRFGFTGVFYGEGGTIDEDGKITIPETSASLTFNLTEDSDPVEFEGIQLGWFGPPVCDTQGELYPMPEHPIPLPSELPFLVRCVTGEDGSQQALILEDRHDPPCTVVTYQLSVRDKAGHVYRHDPKIYSKGPGNGG